MFSKSMLLAISAPFILGIAFSSLVAGQPDRRFDGTWVGTETVLKFEQRGFGGKSDPYPENRKAKIIIAEGGPLLGMVDGFCPGRYAEVSHSGNRLIFRGRNQEKSWGSELTLSANGTTLTENGGIPASIQMFAGGRQDAFSPKGPVFYGGGNAKITGIFHREK
jgi:hypothetical protein